MRRIIPTILPAALVAALCSCAALQQFAALRHVAFSLAGVDNARLAGVPLSRVASYQDLTGSEIARLVLAVAQDDIPLEFDIAVLAENPAENATTATMVRLAWSLYLDDEATIDGVLDSPISLPPGQPVEIPLRMRMDLREFFDGPAESLVNIAAGLVGEDRDPTRIAIRATPTIDTALGPISYPSPITIVSRSIGVDVGDRW